MASDDKQLVSEAAGTAVDALTCVAAIAAELGIDNLASDAAQLAERVLEGRFYVACVGQFKRGKSTLLNALIGEPILPAGITPVTAVATVVRFGQCHAARVRSRGAEWKPIAVAELGQYVSEEHNPENAKQIDGVEVFVPSALLAGGMCLVDTPGLGSVFSANTAATQAFIPHIDAAIVLIGADPPIAGEELALIQAVSQHVRDIIVVLNKSDRVTDAERAAAADFARKMLHSRLQHSVGAVYEVSAVEELEHRGPERDWGKFIAALQDLVEQSGCTLIRSAGERGLRRLTEQLLAIVQEERDALLRPIEDSERRIAGMRRTIADAERALHDLGYLFTAEQHRLSDLFLSRRTAFLNTAAPLVHSELKKAINAVPRHDGPSFRKEVMRAAQDIARAHVSPWLDVEQFHAEQVYGQATQRFVDLADDFLRTLAEAGVPELAYMPHALDAGPGFRTRSRFYFHDFITVAQPASIFRFLGDLALGLFGGYESVSRDAHNFLDHLLEVNSSRIQGDVNTRVLESRHHLEAEIRAVLRNVAGAAERALNNARLAQAAGTATVETAVARLAKLEGELLALIAG